MRARTQLPGDRRHVKVQRQQRAAGAHRRTQQLRAHGAGRARRALARHPHAGACPALLPRLRGLTASPAQGLRLADGVDMRVLRSAFGDASADAVVAALAEHGSTRPRSPPCAARAARRWTRRTRLRARRT